jgi:hypothetical protein
VAFFWNRYSDAVASTEVRARPASWARSLVPGSLPENTLHAGRFFQDAVSIILQPVIVSAPCLYLAHNFRLSHCGLRRQEAKKTKLGERAEKVMKICASTRTNSPNFRHSGLADKQIGPRFSGESGRRRRGARGVCGGPCRSFGRSGTGRRGIRRRGRR